ncbi:hypothetical protein ACWDUL_01125 [Nocardia niigatensis]
MTVIAVVAVIASVIMGITGVLASGLPFFYGIVVGAIAAIGLSILLTGRWHPAQRSHPEQNAISRDLNEHAGGSRHIRTHPSWRDRFENRNDS